MPKTAKIVFVAVVSLVALSLSYAYAADKSAKQKNSKKSTVESKTVNQEEVPEDLVNEFLQEGEEEPVDATLDEDTEWEPEKPKTPPEHTYSLKQIIDMALENSYKLRAAHFDVEIAETYSEKAVGAWLPKIKVSAYVAPAPAYDKPSSTDFAKFFRYNPDKWDYETVLFRTDAGIVIPVYSFGKISTAMDLAELNTEMAKLKELKTKADVIYQARKAYYTMQFVNDLIDVLEEGLRVARESRDKLISMLNEGSESVTNVDLYKLDVIIGELEARLEEAYRRQKVLLAAVRVLIGLPPDAPVYLDAVDLETVDYKPQTYDKYLRLMFNARPEAHMIGIGLRLAEENLKLSIVKMMPDLYISGFVSYAKTPGAYNPANPYFSDPFNYLSGGIFLGMRWKFDPLVQLSAYRKAKLTLLKANEQAKLARLGLTLELKKAYEELLEKHRALEINRKSYKAGKSWLIAETMNYSIGLASTKDVIEAIAAYAKTQIYYYTAIYKYNLAVARMLYVIGKQEEAIKNEN